MEGVCTRRNKVTAQSLGKALLHPWAWAAHPSGQEQTGPIQESPPSTEGPSPCSHTSQGVVGIEPQSKVPEAGKELGFHLPGGGVVHALQGEG
jgi:hypothetical protein